MNHHNPDAEAALEEETIALLAELGWEEWANCYQESAADCAITGRDTRSEVVLKPRLRSALERLNDDLPRQALELAIGELTRSRGTLLPAQANGDVYELLKKGVRVTYRTVEGDERVDVVRVIDWDDPHNNDFFLAQQMWITGDVYTRRPDLMGFVNGIPLVLFELKKHANNVKEAYEGNLSDYKDTIPRLFWYTGFIVLSSGSDARMGALTTPWRHFAQWKRINDEGEEGVIALDTLLRATCTPERLLDLVENFIVYQEARGGLDKIVAKNHQYLGVNNAIDRVHEIQENQGRLGVFWHTQGSGKSFSMIFFSQKILRKVPGNWTFVIITDRRDLDDQIYKTFASTGAVTEPENLVRAQSGEHLKQLLREDHRYVFTLIHKFHTEPGQRYPVLSERDDIIVITDEAHRTQYDILAQNMRNALPNAAFIGFTGTPLMAGEELTREVFGDYVSIYNFKQSIEDRATVPLYYENRAPLLKLENPDQFDEDLEALLEEAMLDETQERKLETAFRREYHIIARDDRLEKIAEDIVYHFLHRGYQGKAMVVSIDKLTAVRMYEKVQKYWQMELAEIRAAIETETDDLHRAELEDRARYMAETDMAVVISEGQNEVAFFREKGLDIVPHRKRMKEEDLDEKFKDPNDPFRLVFVCAMWMTGFDVPSCSTIYLDKPMRNHTLMQTIARANRVFGEKVNGLIVDYIGVFRSLQKALAIYATTEGGIEEGERPIASKDALVEDLRELVEEALEFCADLGFDPQAIAPLSGFERVAAMDDAVDAILVNDETKREFLALANQVDRLYRAILPDERANEFYAVHGVLGVLAAKIKADEPDADISEIMEDVEDLLDRSVAAEAYVIHEPTAPFDLSKIDFDALREQFETGHKRIQANKLRGRLNSKLRQMVRLNETRMDYLERLQQMIDEYNAGQSNVDVFFEKLLALANDLSEEEQRGIRENLTEEELALFDILVKPRPEMTNAEIEEVKEAARELLHTLKAERLVLDWRKQQQTRAGVRVTIEKVLDNHLPQAYDEDWFEEKCDRVYNHVHEKYRGAGQSVYAVA